jgi:hypothetical protein
LAADHYSHGGITLGRMTAEAENRVEERANLEGD